MTTAHDPPPEAQAAEVAAAVEDAPRPAPPAPRALHRVASLAAVRGLVAGAFALVPYVVLPGRPGDGGKLAAVFALMGATYGLVLTPAEALAARLRPALRLPLLALFAPVVFVVVVAAVGWTSGLVAGGPLGAWQEMAAEVSRQFDRGSRALDALVVYSIPVVILGGGTTLVGPSRRPLRRAVRGLISGAISGALVLAFVKARSGMNDRDGPIVLLLFTSIGLGLSLADPLEERLAVAVRRRLAGGEA